MATRSVHDPDIAFADEQGAEHRVYLLGPRERIESAGGSVLSAPVVVRVTDARGERWIECDRRDRLTWGWITRLVCEGTGRKPLVATDEDLTGIPDKDKCKE